MAHAVTLAASRLARSTVFVGMLLLTVGCSTINEIGPSSCDRSAGGNVPVAVSDGEVTGDGNNLVYRTSAFDGEFLYFPGGMRYALEHGLGVTPDYWQAYLSFDRYGERDDNIALATGNQVEMLSMDAESLVLANGSCSDYWLLVVAGTNAGQASGNDGGQGGGGQGGGGQGGGT